MAMIGGCRWHAGYVHSEKEAYNWLGPFCCLRSAHAAVTFCLRPWNVACMPLVALKVVP